MSRPLRSTATPASSGFPATTSRSASERLNRYSMPPVSAVGTLPLAARRTDPQARTATSSARLLTFRARAADQAHAASTPDTAWPVVGTPARLISKGLLRPSISMPSEKLTTLHQRTPTRSPQRALSGTSSWSPPDAIKHAFSLSLTTTVFSQRSTGRFGASPRRATPEGQQASISSTAPPIWRLRLHQPSFSVRDTRPSHKYPNSAFRCGRCTTATGGRARFSAYGEPRAATGRMARARCAGLTPPFLCATASAGGRGQDGRGPSRAVYYNLRAPQAARREPPLDHPPGPHGPQSGSRGPRG